MFDMLSVFFGPWKTWPQMAPNRARKICFLLTQTLPTFWAERIWILRISIFEIFWIPDFWISRFPDFRNLARAGLVPGLSHLDQKNWMFNSKYWCLSSRPPVLCRRDESKCHQVLVFPNQNERVLRSPLKAPLPRPLEPLIASSVWGIRQRQRLMTLAAMNSDNQ